MNGTLQRRLQWYVRAQWLGGAATVALAVAAYLLVCRPADLRARAVDVRLKQSRTALAALETKVAALPQLREELARLGASIDSFHHRLDGQLDPPAALKSIAAAAQQAAVTKLSCEPQPSRKVDDVNELPVAVAFQGGFPSAFTFLRSIENGETLARVRSLRVRTHAGAKAGQVDVQMALSVYSAAEP